MKLATFRSSSTTRIRTAVSECSQDDSVSNGRPHSGRDEKQVSHGASASTRLDALKGTPERAEHDRDPWPPAGEIVGRYQTLQPVGERAVGYEVDCRRRAGVGRQRALDDPDVRLEHQLASHPRLEAEP